MASPTSSYLNTLPTDDAIAFLASLQTVKDHLNSELEWMRQQVQQKEAQLAGIESLLTEATTLGLPTADAEAAIAPTIDNPEPIQTSPTRAEVESEDLNQTSPSNGKESPPAATAQIAKPQASPSSASKTQTKPQTGIVRKPSSTKGKKPKTASESKSSQGAKDLRDLLRPQFAGKSLTDTVAEILEIAEKPLHLDAILIEMYGTLSNADFKRAKISLTNVLSLGKGQGKWRNLGQGIYAANSMPAS